MMILPLEFNGRFPLLSSLKKTRTGRCRRRKINADPGWKFAQAIANLLAVHWFRGYFEGSGTDDTIVALPLFRMSEDRKLRFGVIGAGAFAEACHIPGLLSHPFAEVVGLCGRSREKTRALADRFNIRFVTTDPAELCSRDDLDGITICTPNATHHEFAMLAFAHDKNVFCEKPLAVSVAEAEAMAAAAEASRRVHQVAFTYRYLQGVMELRRRVAAGDVGEPFNFRAHHENWHGLHSGVLSGWRASSSSSGGGVLNDVGSHLFDLARFVLGPISAIRANLDILPRIGVASDDIATVWFRFVSGVSGQWYASRVTPPQRRNHVLVVGREGALEACLSRGGLDGLRGIRPHASWEELPLPNEGCIGEDHTLGRMMRSFVESCFRGHPVEFSASFHDGLAVQRAISAVKESAGAGWTNLDPAA